MVALHDATGLYPSLLARAVELAGNQTDAEDLVQTAYLRMCEEPPLTEDPVEFKHWMRTVVLNLYRDNRRRQVRALVLVDLVQCQLCGSHDARCRCCG